MKQSYKLLMGLAMLLTVGFAGATLLTASPANAIQIFQCPDGSTPADFQCPETCADISCSYGNQCKETASGPQCVAQTFGVNFGVDVTSTLQSVQSQLNSIAQQQQSIFQQQHLFFQQNNFFYQQ